MWLLTLVIFCLAFLGLYAIGELIAVNTPNSWFYNFWRKYFIYECQDCE